MRNSQSIFCVLVIFSVCVLQAESSTKIRENFENVAQDSKDLAYSVGSLLHSVGNAVVNQTKKLGNTIADYVESLQQSNINGSIQVQINENDENVTIIIDGLENIDPITCRKAELIVYESWPIRVKSKIRINDNTTVTLSSNGYTTLSVTVETIKQLVEEKKEESIAVTASALKQQDISKSVTTERSVDLEKLTIDLDTAVNQMVVTIPYSVQTVKSVPVNIK